MGAVWGAYTLLVVFLFYNLCSASGDVQVPANQTLSHHNQTIPINATEATDLEEKLTNETSTDAEKLPTPEALHWKPTHSSRYAHSPDLFRTKQPSYLTLSEIQRRIKSSLSKDDYFYKNRKGEWIYIVPEEILFPETSPVRRSQRHKEKSRDTKQNIFSFRNEDETDRIHSRPSYHTYDYRARNPPAPPTQEPVSFLAKLINTGHGFLRYLNPLTYLRSKDPGPSFAYYPKQHYREGYYRPHSAYEGLRTYRKRPSYQAGDDEDIYTEAGVYPKFETEVVKGYPETAYRYYSDDYDFGHYTYPADDYDLYDEKYNDYTEKYNDYEVKYEDYDDKFEKVSEFQNHYGSSSIFDNHNSYKETGKLLPRPPPSYDPRNKDHTENNKDKRTDYNNIYKFQDLEMLYDPETLEKIKQIQDEHTLEYLKENRLRDDLYIGKDGNLYLKDKKDDSEHKNSLEERGDFFGHKMYGMDKMYRKNKSPTSKWEPKLPNSSEKRTLRTSYTSIDRNRRLRNRAL